MRTSSLVIVLLAVTALLAACAGSEANKVGDVSSKPQRLVLADCQNDASNATAFVSAAGKLAGPSLQVEILTIRASPRLESSFGSAQRMCGLVAGSHVTRKTVRVTRETCYAKSGDVYIAFQVVGDGELDFVWIPSLTHHVELSWEVSSLARFLERLVELGRLIVRQAWQRYV